MTFRLRNVCYRWKARPEPAREIFRDLTLDINPGESVGILGKEGSGKTTMLNLLGGLLRADNGTVLINGTDPHHDRESGNRNRLKIAFTFQFPDEQFLCPTVGEEFHDVLALRGAPERESQLRMAEALRVMGMDPEAVPARSPFSLSLGEARRVALALAAAARPEAVIMDEPTSGLDAEGAACAVRVLRSLRQAGVTVVVATHDTDLVSLIAGRVIILEAGRIAFDGATEKVLSDRALLLKFGFSAPEFIPGTSFEEPNHTSTRSDRGDTMLND